MIREWADADTQDRIDDALEPPIEVLARSWDDDEAWSVFQSAMQAERQ